MIKDLRCPECGAPARGMKLCHELFDDLLAMKYHTDGEAYRLAVACYTLQHPSSHAPKAVAYAYHMLYGRIRLGHDLFASRTYAEAQIDAGAQVLPPTPAPEDWGMDISEYTALPREAIHSGAIRWCCALLDAFDRSAQTE